MTFRIEWDKKPLNFLGKLPKEVAMRILNKVDLIKENPFHFLEHYEGRGYKLRIGNYRMLVDMDLEKKTMVIQVLDKRERIYKK